MSALTLVGNLKERQRARAERPSRSIDNVGAAFACARRNKQGGTPVDFLFSAITEDTFRKILLFVHFLLAVALPAAVTLQALTVLMPARQAAGHFIDRGPVEARSYTTLIVVLYVIQAVMAARSSVKYRTYARIPMEELRCWWTVGSFEFQGTRGSDGVGSFAGLLVCLAARRRAARQHTPAGEVFLALSVWFFRRRPYRQ
jgi:hypothetical protein